MKTIHIFIILVLTTLLLGQSGNTIDPEVSRLKDLPAKQDNVIDMQAPGQKVKAVRMQNPQGEIRKANREFGMAKDSGPAQILQNDEEKITVSKKELKQYLPEAGAREAIK